MLLPFERTTVRRIRDNVFVFLDSRGGTSVSDHTPTIPTDFRFCDFPVRFDPAMLRYVIKLVNPNGHSILIDLRHQEAAALAHAEGPS